MEDWTNKRKEVFLSALAKMIKKDPTTAIRKHDNDLKVHENLLGKQLKRI